MLAERVEGTGGEHLSQRSRACLRLMSAVPMEQDEAWATTGRLYLRSEGGTEKTA